VAARSDGLLLRVQRVLAAPPPLVYGMHVEPKQLAQWWGPKGFTAPSIDLDVRVGGSYRIEMQPPDGDRFFLSGEFREIDPPDRLIYTFRWEDPDPDDRETLVTFSLQQRDDATQVIVEQGLFATAARKDLHEQGWTESLDRLDAVLADQDRDR
jgi:uncharacterized protein YndB with AHSA1/START domain